MNEEFDLEKFVELFDTAMTSNNPTVRKAFKNLLIVAALVDAEDTSNAIGPLKSVLNHIKAQDARIRTLETNQYKNTTYGPITTTMPTINTPWPNSISGGYGTGVGLGTGGGGGGSSTWTAPSFTQTTLSQSDMDRYMKIYNIINNDDE